MEHIWFEDDGMDQNLIMHFAEELAQPLPLEILEENPNIIATNKDHFEITVSQCSNELFKQHFRMSLATFEVCFLPLSAFKCFVGVDAGDSDSFAREGDDGLLMTFKRYSFTVDTRKGVDTELEIGRRSDGELDATDGELNPEVLFEGLAQEETVWPKFIVESSSNNIKNLA
ncbi:hypothetical protein FQA39_LY16523 [Lamprigera yunnana]|nr:hypothetical protein FQA39_LY16523 [Lamprigera yunnana]